MEVLSLDSLQVVDDALGEFEEGTLVGDISFGSVDGNVFSLLPKFLHLDAQLFQFAAHVFHLLFRFESSTSSRPSPFDPELRFRKAFHLISRQFHFMWTRGTPFKRISLRTMDALRKGSRVKGHRNLIWTTAGGHHSLHDGLTLLPRFDFES